jgi:hypothetical protein
MRDIAKHAPLGVAWLFVFCAGERAQEQYAEEIINAIYRSVNHNKTHYLCN